MRELLVILALVVAAALLPAQEGAVADLLRIDVACGYGGFAPSLPPLDPGALVAEERSEPGLLIRFATMPVIAHRTIASVRDEDLLQFTWAPRGRGVTITWGQQGRWGANSFWSSSEEFDSPLAFWQSGAPFRLLREDLRFRPAASAGGTRLLYLLVLPRRSPDDAEAIPALPTMPDIDGVLAIASRHHATTGAAESRFFIADLARFVPVSEVPRRGLEEFLDFDRLRTGLDRALRPRRRRVVSIGIGEEPTAYRAHQALLRAGHEAALPEEGAPFLQEDYAVYRQMLESGFLKDESATAVLMRLLGATASTRGHDKWIALLESGSLRLPAGRSAEIVAQLRREQTARSPARLALLAAVNLLGLGLLILALRLLCRKLLFR